MRYPFSVSRWLLLFSALLPVFGTVACNREEIPLIGGVIRRSYYANLYSRPTGLKAEYVKYRESIIFEHPEFPKNAPEFPKNAMAWSLVFQWGPPLNDTLSADFQAQAHLRGDDGHDIYEFQDHPAYSSVVGLVGIERLEVFGVNGGSRPVSLSRCFQLSSRNDWLEQKTHRQQSSDIDTCLSDITFNELRWVVYSYRDMPYPPFGLLLWCRNEDSALLASYAQLQLVASFTDGKNLTVDLSKGPGL